MGKIVIEGTYIHDRHKIIGENEFDSLYRLEACRYGDVEDLELLDNKHIRVTIEEIEEVK